MKKIIYLLLLSAIAFSLTACGALDALDLPPLPDVAAIKAEEAAQAEAEAAAQATELEAANAAEILPTASPLLNNHVIVKIEPFSETYLDPQNGTEPILEYSYEIPLVYIEGRDAANAAINEHVAAIAETFQTGNDYGYGMGSGLNMFLEMATDNYTYIVNSGEEFLTMLYSYGQTVKVARADEKILSLRYNTYSFTGGAHGNYVDSAYVFDTETGERITLDMLSADSEALRSFLVDYMLSLYETDEGGYYSQRISEDILFGTSLKDAITALLREQSWYLGEEGLVIFSDIYELGPYAAGICEFVVPYAELADKIEPRYMPVEKSGEGSFSLIRQSELSEGSAQIIDRVTVNAEGEQLCLVADGMVYDVRLAAVSYIDRFYETAQLWACSYMKDCLLQLDVMIPEGMPNLMLSYTDGAGAHHSLLLTQSGEDGSLILVDDDIEAVG